MEIVEQFGRVVGMVGRAGYRFAWSSVDGGSGIADSRHDAYAALGVEVPMTPAEAEAELEALNFFKPSQIPYRALCVA